MSDEITISIGLVCSVLGAVVGILAQRRAQTVYTQTKAKEDGVLISEIGYIKSGIDDIKRKQEKQDERIYALLGRVSKIEAKQTEN